MFSIAIEFCLENPKGGLRFMPLDTEQDQSDVYLCTIDHNSHFWFPCISSYNELCTWKIEVTVENDLNVIASGNLIEVEDLPSSFLNDENEMVVNDTINTKKSFKKFHYYLSNPTSSNNIGIVIGKFESITDDTIVNSEVTYYYTDDRLEELVKNTTSFVHELIEFYDELFSNRLPYNTYKQIYMPDILDDCINFAGLSILK